MSRKQMLM